MRVVYVAHRLGHGPDRESNRQEAARWVAWLAERYEVAPVADWIILSGEWSEERRTLGLAIDKALVELVGTVILVGERVSAGMEAEANWARCVIDLTGLEREHVNPLDRRMAVNQLDRRMAAAGLARRVAS